MNSTASSTRAAVWAVVIVVVCLLISKLTIDRNENPNELHSWLKKNSLSFLTETLQDNGIHSVEELLSMDLEEFVKNNELNSKQTKTFTKTFNKLQNAHNKLIRWLERNDLETYLKGFYKLGYFDLEVITEEMDEYKMEILIASVNGSPTGNKQLIQAVKKLRGDSDGWIILHIIYFFFQCIFFLFKWIFKLLLLATMFYLVKNYTLRQYHIIHARQPRGCSFYQYLLGNFLNPSSCQVNWLWKDEIQVGKSVTFILKLFKRNIFLSYNISGRENILIEVRNNGVAEEIIQQRDLRNGKNALSISFNPKKSGKYKILILVNGENINGSPFIKTFLPGPVDLSNITVLNGINMMVLTRGLYYHLKVETRDKYNNLCRMENMTLYKVHIKQIGSSTETIDPQLIILPNAARRNELYIKVEEQGCFHTRVTYKDQAVTNGSFVIVSLDDSDADLLKKATEKNSWHQTWYEAFLVQSDNLAAQSLQGTDMTMSDTENTVRRKSRKVYCYFSARQLTVKEFYLKFIPYRLCSFRISPSTKIIFPENDDSDLTMNPGFVLDDGIQPPVAFMSPKRSLIVATFARFLLRNIGGAESFKDKKQFFFKALQSHHGGEKSGLLYGATKTNIRVDRRDILTSSYQATKNLSTSKWCRQFYVKFEGEPGYDAGGLTREWISVLSTALFDPKNELFTQFNKDDKQALIYPNPSRPSHLKLKYYEFAGRIVGKCIFESSCDAFRNLNVKARFARSFLAQLIGLRVNYKYFKTDDKQLYSSKIKYIQDVDPEDLNLFFSEEEYDSNGRVVKEIDLIPDGCKIPVTEQNKMKYLDAMAQYRLHTRVSDEMDAFLKGFNEIVPDNLLTMFSEQELELLICGISDISVNDLKSHHKLFSEHSSFKKIMIWFWKIIALFNQEEIARLLQFTTGSSQLPHGGFAQLKPTFSFMSSPFQNVLPKAHTCFNQLVLPDYSSYEEFQRCLHLAITEGCEGFGFE